MRKGDRASLICEASGDRPMDISWRRNGIPISPDEDARSVIDFCFYFFQRFLFRYLYYYCVKNGRFNIVEHSDNGSGGEEEEEATTDFVSRFHIAPILDQDTGEISCEVANRFGRDSKTFLLSIEGST